MIMRPKELKRLHMIRKVLDGVMKQVGGSRDSFPQFAADSESGEASKVGGGQRDRP